MVKIDPMISWVNESLKYPILITREEDNNADDQMEEIPIFFLILKSRRSPKCICDNMQMIWFILGKGRVGIEQTTWMVAGV